MTGPGEQAASPPRLYVEPHPAGGWTVRISGHDAPVSRHDTEEEARAKAAAYQRGVEVQGKSVLAPAAGAAGRPAVSSRARAELTSREIEVLRLTALGFTSAAAGARLGISPRTVETHRAHIHRKLGTRSRAQLVTFALRRGLLVAADEPPPKSAAPA